MNDEEVARRFCLLLVEVNAKKNLPESSIIETSIGAKDN